MNFCVFVGIACVIAHAAAQSYAPAPRPQFPGATLVQGPPPPSRVNFRQRGSARAIPEPVPIQPVPVPIDQPSQLQRLRRPQQIPRARAQFVQPQVFDQPRNSVIDEIPPVQYKPKISLPGTIQSQFQPSPQLPPQTFQQIPQQAQAPKLLTPRPVVEDEVNEASEEEAPSPVTTPSTTTAFTVSSRPTFPQPGPILQSSQIPVAYQRPQLLQQTSLRPQSPPPQPVGFPETASLQARQFIRPQVRPPIEQQIPLVRPVPQQTLKSKEDQIGDEPQYFRQQVRPQKKQEPIPRQQVIEQDQFRAREPVRQIPRPQQQIRQQQQELPVQRPIQREPHVKASHQRERKPVAQTIRKYHEEHEDGSITWGYENDDGSFKEETIGVDCVTRGKYGYYDPDGVKREYTYQTGIPCDRQAQEAEEAESARHEGYIDYTNNKYVLPNGDEIDLEAMVKNRARKPVQRYRN